MCASRNHTRSPLSRKKHSICRPCRTRARIYPSRLVFIFCYGDEPRAPESSSRTRDSDRGGGEERGRNVSRYTVPLFRPRRAGSGAHVYPSRIRIESKLGRNEIFRRRRRANTGARARSLLTYMYVCVGSRIPSRRISAASSGTGDSCAHGESTIILFGRARQPELQ